MKLPGTVDLVLWGLMAAGAVILLGTVKGWHDKAKHDLPAALAQVEILREDYDALSKRQAENATKTKDAGNEFDKAERARAAAAADTPVRTVFVCRGSQLQAPARAAVGDATESDDGAGAPELPGGARQDPQEGGGTNGYDAGPELYALMDRANRVVNKLTTCQKWADDNP